MQPSEELLRGLIGAAPDALIVVDRSGRIVYASDAVELRFGWQVEDLRDAPIEVLVSLEAQSGLDDAGSGQRLELSARRKDGSRCPVEVCLGTFEHGGELLRVAAIRDASERAELAEGLVHDFNNLLGVIMNYATLVARRVDDPVAKADLGEIRGAAERAVGLVSRLVASPGQRSDPAEASSVPQPGEGGEAR